MNKDRLKKGLVAAATGVLIAGGLALSGASAASAIGFVPNRYACDINTGQCYQINGAYNPTVSRECHWRYGGTAGKPNTINVNSCNGWGNPLWINV